MTEDPDLARLSRISDSVFAVVVTLLAYRVRLPSPEALAAPDWVALGPFLSDLLALVISFLVAVLFWMGHWGAFRRMRRADARFVALHFAFLGFLMLLPISTSLMSAAHRQFVGAFAYSANLFMIGVTLLLFRAHARRLQPESFGAVPVLLGPTLLVAIFGSAAVVSLLAPVWAELVWCLAFVVSPIEHRWGIGRLSRTQPVRPAPPAAPG